MLTLIYTFLGLNYNNMIQDENGKFENKLGVILNYFSE